MEVASHVQAAEELSLEPRITRQSARQSVVEADRLIRRTVERARKIVDRKGVGDTQTRHASAVGLLQSAYREALAHLLHAHRNTTDVAAECALEWTCDALRTVLTEAENLSASDDPFRWHHAHERLDFAAVWAQQWLPFSVPTRLTVVATEQAS